MLWRIDRRDGVVDIERIGRNRAGRDRRMCRRGVDDIRIDQTGEPAGSRLNAGPSRHGLFAAGSTLGPLKAVASAGVTRAPGAWLRFVGVQRPVDNLSPSRY